jgi:methionyl-tRNA formyltransferase
VKILVAAYRDWAMNAYHEAWVEINKNGQKHVMECAQTPDDFALQARNSAWDVIILIGWSWKVSADIVNHELVVGMHPSDLPMYAGGSPIQNQILDGVEQTSATLFKLNEQFDQGEIVDKEPIDLRGHLNDVFRSITDATVQLIKRFVENFPNNTYIAQTGEKHVVRRLKPEHSRLNNPLGYLGKPLTCKEMWDHIRCREDPYPNAYFEDETGRLVVKYVEFEPK